MKNFSGVYLARGQVRRMTLEAETLEEATALAETWGIGIEGEAKSSAVAPAAEASAYDLTTTRRLLGNISPATIYRWINIGRLERVPDTRKILITRESVERMGACH